MPLGIIGILTSDLVEKNIVHLSQVSGGEFGFSTPLLNCRRGFVEMQAQWGVAGRFRRNDS
jgi:hypothetical protein